jgi:LmbE family N-acetylglucosaminyl deacetylase
MAVVLGIQPHQDDFALSYAAMADQHLRGDHRVICLTMTDGTGSGAQAVTGLPDAAFTAARDDEDKRALRRLGLRYQDIAVPALRARSGELTAESVALMVAGFIATELPGIDPASLWVKGYSPLNCPGRHPDHVAVGQGIQLLHQENLIGAPRYYVEPWPEMLAAWRDANPGVKLTAQAATPEGKPRIQAAFDEYTRRDLPANDWGIGGISVPKVFAALRPNPVNYWHMPA